MKKYFLLFLLCYPFSGYALQHIPSECPTLNEIKSSSFANGREYKNAYDIMGANTFSGNLWWLYGDAIPGRNLSDAIRKANMALSQGKVIAVSQSPDYSANSATCKYKITVDDNLERDLTAFMVF